MPLHGSSALIGGRYVVSHLGELLVTGEVADTYHVADDGDLEMGMAKSHDTRATAGNADIDVPHYASSQITFTAPSTILDGAAGLATFLNADTIVVRGSSINDGVYTVNVAGGPSFTVNEATIQTDAVAGDFVSIAKRAALSNNVVYDRVTGLLWARYTSDTLKLGDVSDGELVWNNAALHFDLHTAAADLAIVVPDTLRIVGGAAEVGFYTVGDIVKCSGFANAVNNYAGYAVTAVVVNVGDLDITLDPSNNVLIAEVAGGARDIKLVCRSAFGMAEGANVAALGGYDNGWRVPNITEMASLLDFSLNPVTPALAAFPSWPDGHVWTSTTDPSTVANAYATGATDGTFLSTVKTATENVALVRLG